MAGVPTTRRRLTKEQRRDQLLDTAESLFSEAGYEPTTMEDIARAAGVTRAVVYAHFDSKEHILQAGVERAQAELEARLTELTAPAAAGLPLPDILERGGDIFFTLLENTPSRWALMFAPALAGPGHTADHFTALRRATIMRIADIGEHMQPSVPPEQIEAIAYMISGVGEQLGRWWLNHPEVPRATVVSHYRDFILHGVAPLTEAR